MAINVRLRRLQKRFIRILPFLFFAGAKYARLYADV
jgi:hypothetical protein